MPALCDGIIYTALLIGIVYLVEYTANKRRI